mmetsp:Transcript_21954/g.24391  ORF Transcript_21954/g.24391 Transcript_21954/m.24391 type:complete len:257 (+) Transcript_21954:450-1220(+)
MKWMIGLLKEDYNTLRLITRDEPSGVSMRELSTESTAYLYYTFYDSSSEGYRLYKEVTDLSFSTSGQTYESIGKNCGSKIMANSAIIVVSCPSTTSSTAGLISIYKESDLSFIKAVTNIAGSFFIGSRINVISSSYYHQIFYNSKKTQSGDEGQISMLEIFDNRRESGDFEFEITEDAISNDQYNHFGKYFAVHSSNGDHKLFVSSFEYDSAPSAHRIEILNACTHNQFYNSTSGACESLASGYLTYGLQDSTRTL